MCERAEHRPGPDYPVSVNGNDPFLLTLTGLIGTLTLPLAMETAPAVLDTLFARGQAAHVGVGNAKLLRLICPELSGQRICG